MSSRTNELILSYFSEPTRRVREIHFTPAQQARQSRSFKKLLLALVEPYRNPDRSLDVDEALTREVWDVRVEAPVRFDPIDDDEVFEEVAARTGANSLADQRVLRDQIHKTLFAHWLEQLEFDRAEFGLST